jgi:hypothetical protein
LEHECLTRRRPPNASSANAAPPAGSGLTPPAIHRVREHPETAGAWSTWIFIARPRLITYACLGPSARTLFGSTLNWCWLRAEPSPVQEAVGVRERIQMRELPKALAAKKPSFMSRVLGAYWHDERVVFIDPEQPEHRLFWTDAHEGTHAMCPWHAEILRLDNEDTLFKQLYAGIEVEANYGAGHLIFQGGRFHRRALKDQVVHAHTA